MPSAVRGAHQVVLLVADGLGWNQLQGGPRMPDPMSMSGGSITTVAPLPPFQH